MKKSALKNKKVILVIILAVLALAFKLFLDFTYVPAILMYHSIDEKENETKLSLCPAGFARQMQFLYEKGYRVISLDEMVDMIKNKTRVPHKTVAITFDDGYENNYTCAYTILKKYNFPATIFVITGKIGESGYLSWDELSQMQENNITIGSHTKSHPMLKYLPEKKIRDEVRDSKEILERNLGRKVKFIAYPGGSYDERVKSIVKESGYAAACGTNPGPSK